MLRDSSIGSLLLGCLLPALLLTPGCGGGGPAPEVEEVDIPRPDLTAFEPVLRQRIEGLQNRTAEARRRALEAGRDEAARETLAASLGELGNHYHAFLFLDAAAECYAWAARLEPAEVDWHYYLGVARGHQGRDPEALEAYERARELAPGDLAVHVRLGDLYLKLNRPQQAQEAFHRAVELAPDSAAAHFGLGRSAVLADADAEAVEHFERTLELAPEATAVHYPLAQAYRRLGREEESRQHLELHGEGGLGFPDPRMQRVLRIEVDTAIDSVRSLAGRPERLPDSELVSFAAAQMELPGALEAFRHAVESEGPRGIPSGDTSRERADARVHLALGVLLARGERPEAAIEHLRRALELDPDLETAHLPLVRSLRRAGRAREALVEMEALLATRPGDAELRRERGSVLLALGRPREAVTELRRAAASDPEDGGVRLSLAEALAAAGEPVAAGAELERALGLDLPDPDRALALHRLGELARRSGRAEEAIARYRGALQVDPELVDARLGLGAALGSLGRYGEAVEEYRRALARAPRNPAARLGEVTALVLAGREGEARDRLEEGLEALPREPLLLQTLARLLASAADPALRDGPRAVELARRLMEERPTAASAETLAMALAEAGDFEGAVRYQEELLRRARQAGHRAGAARLAANLERYRAGRACCAR